jgi:hypothetical protein
MARIKIADFSDCVPSEHDIDTLIEVLQHCKKHKIKKIHYLLDHYFRYGKDKKIKIWDELSKRFIENKRRIKNV